MLDYTAKKAMGLVAAAAAALMLGCGDGGGKADGGSDAGADGAPDGATASSPLGARCAGCTRSQIGAPAWEPTGVAVFAGLVGTGGMNYLSLLQSILSPRHAFSFEAGAFGPGLPHPAPYDTELYTLLDGGNFATKQSFTTAEFSPPSAVVMLVTVVPSAAAPVGSSGDFASGPIVPNEQFPISIDGSLYRDGMPHDSAFPTTVPGYDRFVPPIAVDGASHFFVPFGVNTEFAPDLSASGSYQYTVVMLDASGAGWAIRVPFTVGGGAGSDGGAGGGGGGVPVCSGTPPASARITDFSDAAGSPITFGSGPEITGGAYAYAAPGLTPPALSLTTLGDAGTARALRVVANPGTPTDVSAGFFGFGLYFLSCVDASAYNGIKFTIAGDLGNCSINFAPMFSEDLKPSDDPKGSCPLDNCYPAGVPLTTPGTKSIRFADLMGGSPGIIDPAATVGVQWQMNTPGAGPCSADFTVTDLSFVTDAAPPICPQTFRPVTPDITGPNASLFLGGIPFTFGAANLAPPTLYLVSSTTTGELRALEVTADPGTTSDPANATVGFGLNLGGGFLCLDASAYTGIKFTATGDLGTCKLTFSATPRQDLAVPSGGGCTASSCYPPQSGPLTTGTSTVRFSEMTGGNPYPTVDVTTLSALQWTLTVPTDADAGACKASLRISDVTFVSN